ncbi:hypothetical protein [Kitasatospora sp. NPDC090091]|uniref:hypothetical protein n=1 Tax=Kitasatospora sp. NPDC090091 TaxID=3364081 RepID=UPI0037F3D124
MAVPARTARPAADERTLRELVGRIGRVPDRYREFGQTAAEATWQHGIDEALLGTLTELGLPCRPGADGPRYDQLDLANVSLSLALPSARFMAMRGWAAAIRSAARASGATSYTVDVLPACPPGPREHDCNPAAAPLLREQPGFDGPAGGPFTLTRLVPARPAAVHPELAALTELVAAVHFHYLPAGLRQDVGFLREAALADCGLAATFLAEEALGLGLTARRSFGLFLSAPYSIAHSWLDVRVDDRWVSFDPHLVNLLTGWNLLPAEEWPSYRSIGEGAWRLADHEFVMAMHDGAETPVSFPTRAAAHDA